MWVSEEGAGHRRRVQCPHPGPGTDPAPAPAPLPAPLCALHPLQNEKKKQFSHHSSGLCCCCAAGALPASASVTWMQILGVNLLDLVAQPLAQPGAPAPTRSHQQQEYLSGFCLLAIPPASQAPKSPRPLGMDQVVPHLFLGGGSSASDPAGRNNQEPEARAGGGEGKCLCAGERRLPSPPRFLC